MKSTSHGHVEVAHQVRQEEDGALQHPDEEQVAARVVGGDLPAQVADPGGQLVLLDEDLADGRIGRGRRV